MTISKTFDWQTIDLPIVLNGNAIMAFMLLFFIVISPRKNGDEINSWGIQIERHFYEFSIDWKTSSTILYNCQFLDCMRKEELPDVSSLCVFNPNLFSNKRLFKENLRLYSKFSSICITVNCILLIKKCRTHLLQICSQWDCTIIFKFEHI